MIEPEKVQVLALYVSPEIGVNAAAFCCQGIPLALSADLNKKPVIALHCSGFCIQIRCPQTRQIQFLAHVAAANAAGIKVGKGRQERGKKARK